MRHLFWAVCASLLWAGFGMTPVRAQSASAEYQAIIGAPSSVELANTTAITIMVSIHRISDDSLPPAPHKVLLVTTSGSWVKDDFTDPDVGGTKPSSEIELDTDRGPCTATLLLKPVSDRVPLRVEVFLPPASPGPQPVSLGSKTIALHYPALIKFLAMPETVPADGRTTGAISLRLFNNVGQGIRNSSFVLHGNGPFSPLDFDIGGVTDDTGRVTFMLPPFSHAGPILLWIYGQGIFNEPIVTRQLEVDYVTNGQPLPKSIILDRDWWKRPYHVDRILGG